jgi:hypothetical protein
LTIARPGGLRRSTGSAGCGASNRSRNSVVSSAPLGHSFSGGLFLRVKPRPMVANLSRIFRYTGKSHNGVMGGATFLSARFVLFLRQTRVSAPPC